MDIEKVKEIIKSRINATKEEYDRQEKLYKASQRYAAPDYGWFAGRTKAFNEALELIGIIDKPNNK